MTTATNKTVSESLPQMDHLKDLGLTEGTSCSLKNPVTPLNCTSDRQCQLGTTLVFNHNYQLTELGCEGGCELLAFSVGHAHSTYKARHLKRMTTPKHHGKSPIYTNKHPTNDRPKTDFNIS